MAQNVFFGADTSKLKKDDLISLMRKFAADKMDVRMRFCTKPLPQNMAACYDCNKNIITISLKVNKSKESMMLALFHELGHRCAYRDGKWLQYHQLGQDKHGKKISADEAFFIENQIDRIAQSMWNEYVSCKHWGRYRFSYPTKHKKSIVEWLENYYN